MRKPKQRRPHNDLSRSLTPLNLNHTLIAVIELSQKSWLVAGIIPGVERQPLKKLDPNEDALLSLIDRWRKEAKKAGYQIERIAVAFEAGRDGFWLARWLSARGIEAHVIHAASVAVSRERRRAGWLRGERDHCKMAAIPTFAEEDAKRPSRERESLVGEQGRIVNRMKATLARLGIRSFNPKLKNAAESLKDLRTAEGEPIPPNTLTELHRDMERRRLVIEQVRQIETARLERLKQAPKVGPNAMVLLLARVIGVGIETADMLVQESCHATCATGVPSRGTRASRARPMKAEANAGRKGSPEPATPGCGGAWCNWPGAFSTSRRTVRWRSGIAPAPSKPAARARRWS